MEEIISELKERSKEIQNVIQSTREILYTKES